MAAVIFFGIVSCERHEDEKRHDGEVMFLLDTKSMLPGVTTYRIMAYRKSDGTYFGDTRPGTSYGYGTGTYYLKEQGKPLVPCSVTETWEYEAEDKDAGIRGSLGEVLLAYVSPAMKNNPDDGTFDFDPGSPFFCSSAKAALIDGYGVVDLNSGAGEEAMLRDMRAKVIVNFYQGTEIGFDIISTDDEGNAAAFIRGAGDDDDLVNFNPATAKVNVASETRGRTCVVEPVAGVENDPERGQLVYRTEHIVPSAEYGNMLALDYEMRQSVGTMTRDIDLSVTLTSENSITKLEPMMIYTFNIIALSGYIYVTMDVYEPDSSTDSWYDVPPLAGSIGQIAGNVPVTAFEIVEGADGGWVARVLSNPSIGSSPSQAARNM